MARHKAWQDTGVAGGEAVAAAAAAAAAAAHHQRIGRQGQAGCAIAMQRLQWPVHRPAELGKAWLGWLTALQQRPMRHRDPRSTRHSPIEHRQLLGGRRASERGQSPGASGRRGRPQVSGQHDDRGLIDCRRWRPLNRHLWLAIFASGASDLEISGSSASAGRNSSHWAASKAHARAAEAPHTARPAPQLRSLDQAFVEAQLLKRPPAIRLRGGMSTPPPLPPPFASGTAGAGETGMPGSVQALASLLGIPLENACATQPPHDNASNALAQLLQLVQQREAQQAAAAPAAPPPQEQVWQQQAWQPPAAPQHEALLAALLQSAAQQQQQPPAPLAYPQPSPQQGFAPPLLSQLVQQPQAPQALAAPPLPAFQPQEGHSQPSAREGAAGGVAAGRKVRVSCNEVPGVLHIDSLYVACECRECEGRVRMGHDRPIFGLR